MSLVSIDEFVALHRGNAVEAATAAGASYFSFRRWLKRISFPAENSNSRKLMAEKGIDLPRKPAPPPTRRRR